MAKHTSESNASTSLKLTFTGSGASSTDVVVPTDPTPQTNQTTPDPVPDTSTTNATTPDTGFFTGNSSLGAAPVIVFCLVILTAVIVLVVRFKKSPHAYHSLSLSNAGLKIRDMKTTIKDLGIFSAILLGLIISGSVILPNFLTDERDTTSALTGNFLNVTVASSLSGSVELSETLPIAAASSSNIAVTGSDYSLYISTNDDSKTGNYLTSGSNLIAPSSGALTSPKELSINEWGFAVNQSLSSAKSNGKIFAGVPAYSANPLKITSSTPVTSILFAARGSKEKTAAGEYTTTILYTAVSNLSKSNIEDELKSAEENTTKDTPKVDLEPCSLFIKIPTVVPKIIPPKTPQKSQKIPPQKIYQKKSQIVP